MNNTEPVDGGVVIAVPTPPNRLPLLFALLMTLLGLTIFDRTLYSLWNHWSSDGLYTIGFLVLPVSAGLAFRAWRWSDWQSGGSWWGAVLVGLACVLELGRYAQRLPVVHLVNSAHIPLLPTGVLFYLYFTGAVIFFGGLVAWRRALFPLSLVLLINPCPAFVVALLDMPLQRLGAQVARAFAHIVGVPVSGDLLHLMFTPESTVFIAPGCDGLRGVISLGFAALVVGHLYRLRPWIHVGYVAVAIMAAYLLNLARLCVVVIYSALSAHVSPTWFSYGATFDYLAGGLMFFFTAYFLLTWPKKHPELCTPKSLASD